MREFNHKKRLNDKIDKALRSGDPRLAVKLVNERFWMNHGDKYAMGRLKKLLKKGVAK